MPIKRIGITLDEDDCRLLIRGKNVVKEHDGVQVDIILADIGYQLMELILAQARVESWQKEKDAGK